MISLKTWDAIKATGGRPALQAFNKVWYEHARLTPEELQLLGDLFAKYPLGTDNFKTWLKQRVRQIYEKDVIANTSCLSRLNVLT